MALENALEGARHTGQQITWSHDDESAHDLTGATITGTIRSVRTGVTQAITGTLALVTAASGIFTWAYSAADIAVADRYQVQFKADYGGGLYDLSYWIDWLVESSTTDSTNQPRSTMLWLVKEVRNLIGAGPLTLDDLQIQDKLDDTRTYVKLLPLSPLPTVAQGGQVYYYEFTAPWGDWEDSVIIQDSGGAGGTTSWGALTPSVSNLRQGRWTFTTNYYTTLYLSGSTYDRWAAAVACLDLLIAQLLTCAINFSVGGQSFNRRQVLDNYREAQRMYRAQMRPMMADMTRADQMVDTSRRHP